jgi:hypothetical protein
LENIDTCRTAVVVTLIAKIVHGDRTYSFEGSYDITMELYKCVHLIQNGEVDGIFGWNIDYYKNNICISIQKTQREE